MHGRCPDYWSKRDKIFYYSRLYDMIKEWKLHKDITQEWFKLNVPDRRVMTLKEMLDDDQGFGGKVQNAPNFPTSKCPPEVW